MNTRGWPASTTCIECMLHPSCILELSNIPVLICTSHKWSFFISINLWTVADCIAWRARRYVQTFLHISFHVCTICGQREPAAWPQAQAITAGCNRSSVLRRLASIGPLGFRGRPSTGMWTEMFQLHFHLILLNNDLLLFRIIILSSQVHHSYM